MNLDPTVFVQYGVLGIMLAWFAIRLEKRLDNHTSVINDLVIAHALDVLSRSPSEGLRGEADKLLQRATHRKTALSS
jgi:hypothetical protein